MLENIVCWMTWMTRIDSIVKEVQISKNANDK